MTNHGVNRVNKIPQDVPHRFLSLMDYRRSKRGKSLHGILPISGLSPNFVLYYPSRKRYFLAEYSSITTSFERRQCDEGIINSSWSIHQGGSDHGPDGCTFVHGYRQRKRG